MKNWFWCRCFLGRSNTDTTSISNTYSHQFPAFLRCIFCWSSALRHTTAYDFYLCRDCLNPRRHGIVVPGARLGAAADIPFFPLTIPYLLLRLALARRRYTHGFLFWVPQTPFDRGGADAHSSLHCIVLFYCPCLPSLKLSDFAL